MCIQEWFFGKPAGRHVRLVGIYLYLLGFRNNGIQRRRGLEAKLSLDIEQQVVGSRVYGSGALHEICEFPRLKRSIAETEQWLVSGICYSQPVFLFIIQGDGGIVHLERHENFLLQQFS